MIPAFSRGGLNHITVANLNGASAAFGMSAFGARPENMCSMRALLVMTLTDISRNFSLRRTGLIVQ
ncbi:MAG: hypothetical protein ACJ8FM_02535 [Xanthobacteraceae bacterium]|jgi:hypothetical protein